MAQNEPYPPERDRQADAAPALPEWTPRQQSRTAPAEAETVPHSQDMEAAPERQAARTVRQVLSPETIIAETPCICKEFLLQSECLQYAKQGGRHE